IHGAGRGRRRRGRSRARVRMGHVPALSPLRVPRAARVARLAALRSPALSSRTANPMKINLTLPSARTLLIGAAALVVAGLLAGGGWCRAARTHPRARGLVRR